LARAAVVFGWAAADFGRLRPILGGRRPDLGKSGGWKGGFWAKAAVLAGFGADGVRAEKKTSRKKTSKKIKILKF
jgi:hypothetical protein